MNETALTQTLLDCDGPAPDARTAKRLKQRLLARVALAAADDTTWGPLFPGAAYRVLHDDGRSFGWLLRMKAGTRLPEHTHDDGDEECLVLEGSVIAQGTRLAVGDYQNARRGSVHDDVWCDEDCLVYLRSASSRRAPLARLRAQAVA